jgi:hypothetical protein
MQCQRGYIKAKYVPFKDELFLNYQAYLVFSLLSKNEIRLIKSPVCLSVCVSPLTTSEPLCRFS